MKLIAAAIVLSALPSVVIAQQTVFSTDFSSIPIEFSGIVTTESVQSYAGIGTGANVFAGDFLHNGAGGNPASASILTLTNLPSHSAINVSFLLGIINTWDGAGGIGGPDYFNVTIDGNVVFQETFGIVSGSTSYTAPPGAYLGFGHFYGPSDGWQDYAYDMCFEPAFTLVPHTASTATIAWYGSGTTYEGTSNPETWAIDNVVVQIVPEPAMLSFAVVGSIGLLGRRRRL